MPTIILQAVIRSDTNLPRDNAVNTFHFDVGGPADFGDFTDALAQAYADNLNGVLGGVNRVTVSAYNMDDPSPREPQNVAFRDLSNVDPGPREVAFCLSYFAQRNLPRQRGRVYLGPIALSRLDERPDMGGTGVGGKALAFGNAVAAIGNLTDSWVVYSPTANDTIDITDIWVDNEWDTMRSRGLRGTARVMDTV